MKNSIRTIQGAANLAFDSVLGITSAVEQMHETIARHPLPWSPQPASPRRAHGAVAAAVYTTIRRVSKALQTGVDQSLERVADAAANAPRSKADIRMVAALNGAVGDHLEASNNPLRISMALMTPTCKLTLTRESITATLERVSPHLVVLVHGLSLSELSWSRSDKPAIGVRLQEKTGSTPLYLRYNSGRHVSTNGREFAQLMEQLCAAWPVPVESISVIGHSMGGLVTRSACWYAEQAEHGWLGHLRRVICLGTPHHGSVVAKAGHALHAALTKSPYTLPLAFGRKRSAGIKDLRHGDLLDEDWQPEQSNGRARRIVPLTPHVTYCFIAGSVGRDPGDPLGLFLGDLLVRADSATGSHRDKLQHLRIKPENCRVFHEKNHFDLLNDERVHKQIVRWFENSSA